MNKTTALLRKSIIWHVWMKSSHQLWIPQSFHLRCQWYETNGWEWVMREEKKILFRNFKVKWCQLGLPYVSHLLYRLLWRQEQSLKNSHWFYFFKIRKHLGEGTFWNTKPKRGKKIYTVNRPDWLNITWIVQTTWKQFWHGLLRKRHNLANAYW